MNEDTRPEFVGGPRDGSRWMGAQAPVLVLRGDAGWDHRYELRTDGRYHYAGPTHTRP